MKKDLIEIICIIDKSGSMHHLTSDTIGGFDNFIAEQKKLPGEARVTTVLFDTNYRILYHSNPIESVPSLAESYHADGNTALLDAIGYTIKQMTEGFEGRAVDETPEKVMLVILTDGEENSSKEYKKADIKTLIEEKANKDKWEIIYLGANQDAFVEAGKLGIAMSKTANFHATGQSVNASFNAMNMAATNYRSGGNADLDKDQY